jgi:hypothetical protein
MDQILESNDIDIIFNYFYDTNYILKSKLTSEFVNNQAKIVGVILDIIHSHNLKNKYNIALIFAKELVESNKIIIVI